MSRLWWIASAITLLFVAMALTGGDALAARECRWFGTKPFCDGKCPTGWTYTGNREPCTTGSRRECCREVARAPLPSPRPQECRWFGTKPFCDGKCPSGWQYTGKREPCTTGSRRYCCTLLPAIEPRPSATAISVLAYNIYMRPTTLFKNGQSIRAGLLPRYLRGYDVLIFSEAFDDDVRRKLLGLLRGEYPHATRVVGTDRGVEQDGGVIIVSRWPIEKQEQRRFGRTCAGSDCKADKGVAYARINKQGRRYHIFGTHTQAWPTAEGARVRRQQFQIIRHFIQSLAIPRTEPVIIGGDLNVDKIRARSEYSEMLRLLEAAHPPTSGHPYSFDPRTNKLASSGPSEFLDYVLYSRVHLLPREARNEIRRIRSVSAWKEFPFEKDSFDLSDHYPVFGHFRF